MTPNQIVSAYKAVVRLSESVFPYKTARSIARLKKRLGEEVDAIAAAETAIVKKYGGNVSQDGLVHIGDGAKADKLRALRAEMNEFRRQDDEVKLPVLDISEYVDALRISPADIDALEGIVIFDREEKGGDG